MMKKLIVSLFVAVAVIASAFVWLDFDPVEPLVLKNRMEAEWSSLSVTEKSLGPRSRLEDWSAGVFLGTKTVDLMLQQLVGARLEYAPVGDLASGTTIEIKSVKVVPALGNTLAEIVLVARKGALELELGLKGLVSFQGADTQANVSASPIVVETTTTSSVVSSSIGESIAEVEAALRAALTTLSPGILTLPAVHAIGDLQGPQRLNKAVVQLPRSPPTIAGQPSTPQATVAASAPRPVEFSAPGQAVANFRIDPLEVTPVIRFGPLQVSAKRFWRELLPDLVVAFADPQIFKVSVPLNDGLKFALGMNETTKETVNKETKATITYEVTMPISFIEQRITYAAPVFRPEGIWLLARHNGFGQETLKPEKLPPAEKLDSELEALRARVDNLTRGFTGDALTASVWISSHTFSSIGSSLSKLNDASRRISIQSLEREGRLAEEKWRDNLLGEGGAYAELVDGRSASATLQLGQPSVAWDAAGLKIDMSASAAVAANIHLHFDPLIGGGMGTSVGIQGAGSGKAVVLARPVVLVDDNGTRLAAMDTHLSCDAIKTNVTTDGVMKVDMGWIKVPKLGVKVTLPIGRQQIGALALFDNRPLFVATPSWDPRQVKDETKRVELIKKNPWAHYPASGGIKLRIIPENIASDESGVRATVSFAIERLNINHDAAQLESAREAIKKEAATVAERSMKLLKKQRPVQECSGDPEVAVLFGPIEFGSNNDIVKFAKNAWNDLTIGPGENNDLRKAVESFAGAVDKVIPTVSTGGDHGGLGVTVGGWKF